MVSVKTTPVFTTECSAGQPHVVSLHWQRQWYSVLYIRGCGITLKQTSYKDKLRILLWLTTCQQITHIS